MRDLWRSIGFTIGARVYSLVAATIGLVITARVLGPEGRGTVAAAITWALLFSTIGYLSLGQVALYRATGKPASDWLGSTLAALLVMTAVVTITGWVVALAIYAISGGDVYGEIPLYALILGFLALPLLVWQQYGSSLLTALGRISVYNRAEIAGRSVGLALVVVLVAAAGIGVSGALVAVLLGNAVVAAGGLRYLIRRAGSALSVSRSVLRQMLIGGTTLHLNAIGTFLFTSAAVLIVQYVRGPAETGPFQAVVQLMTAALFVPQAAAMVIYGEVARLGPDRAWDAHRRVLLTVAPVMVGVAVLASLAAPTLIPLALGDSFSTAIPVFQILAFALVGQTFAMVMAPQWIGRGLFWQASALTLVLGVCNVIACFILVDAHGMKGAAFSLLGVSVVSIFGNGAMAWWVQRQARTDRPTDRDRSPLSEDPETASMQVLENAPDG